MNLIRLISEIADKTYAVIEQNVKTSSQSQFRTSFKSPIEKYMLNVKNAEKHIFDGNIDFKKNIMPLKILNGEINSMKYDQLKCFLQSDLYIVFGSSFIKGWLANFLEKNKALNVHMGLSPYYRGSACNFWALYDSLPNFVGGTVHLLTKGLDSGPIIFHSVPKYSNENLFEFTMNAVKQTQEDLVYFLKRFKKEEIKAFEQNKDFQIRYSRVTEFTAEIAKEFVSRKLTTEQIIFLISNTVKPNLIEIPRFN